MALVMLLLGCPPPPGELPVDPPPIPDLPAPPDAPDLPGADPSAVVTAEIQARFEWGDQGSGAQ